MQYRMMGSSDLKVSAIGFGCWEMGGTYGSFDEQEVIDAIHRAIDLGVTLFDTARVYGFTRPHQLGDRSVGRRRPLRGVAGPGARRAPQGDDRRHQGRPADAPEQREERDRRDSRRGSVLQDSRTACAPSRPTTSTST